MRIVRRASLVLSLTLIVAIAVGFVARLAAIANERDDRLVTSAEVGASLMSSIVDAVEISAATGTDAQRVAVSLVAHHPSLGVCAIDDGGGVACAGSGLDRSSTEVQDRLAGRAPAGSRLIPLDGALTIEVAGPDVSVVAVTPYSAISTRDTIDVWATTILRDGHDAKQFVVEHGIRQYAVGVPSTTDLYVLAATRDHVSLPTEELRFYALIFSLAVVLLLLAGVTLYVEHRNLVERASFDPLTRLPNRGEFERRAQEALVAAQRNGSSVCLLLFDLNGFKLVNDTYGHAAGDEMLKVVGSRLRKAVRDEDIVARWGGDEFIVVMPGIEDDEMGVLRAQQLADQVSGRTRLDGVADPLRVKVSVGVAIWPRHGAALDELVEAADHAMYQAKRDGEACRVADAAASGDDEHRSRSVAV